MTSSALVYKWGKTSQKCKHIQARVIKSGQDLMLLRTENFIYMQTREPRVYDSWELNHTNIWMASRCCWLGEQDHFMCSLIKIDELFVLVGQNVIENQKHLMFFVEFMYHLCRLISISPLLFLPLRFHTSCHWRTNLYLISWYTIYSYANAPHREKTLGHWNNNPNLC